MAAPRKTTPRAPKPAAVVARLPKLTVGKVESAGALLERMISENTDVFIKAGQEYRDKHREGTGRHLSPIEIGQLAAAMGRTLTETKDDLEDGDIRYWDEPSRNEVLMAAGAATAPAFIRAALRFTALIEMPEATFVQFHDDDALDDAINEAVVPLRGLGVKEARGRASNAMDHFSMEVADRSGKGMARAIQLFVQTLMQGMDHLTPSELSSLIDSAPSTEDSPSTTSSTSSGTPAPSN